MHLKYSNYVLPIQAFRTMRQAVRWEKKTVKKQYAEKEKNKNKRYLVVGIFEDEMPTRRRAYTKLSTR
ncbi:hypothetical protein N7527_012156 [Penicillium freii]|nr:hypothetical protein N7527_012156 [Penicillium freii]